MPSLMISQRLKNRLLTHHLPTAITASIAAWALYVTRPYQDVVSRVSFATAYPALALLAISLLIGPIRLLMGKGMPVSLDLRRDLGIWAGIVGTIHAVVGQCVHLRWRPWLYYIYENWQQKHFQPFRHDLFGLANYTGLVAVLVLATLLATSNNVSLRQFGAPGWKALQRWNYACFALTAVHTFAYQLGVENQKLPFVAATIACVTLTSAFQFVGYLRRRPRAA